MDETAISDYITSAFDSVETVTVDDNTFFFYDPDHMFPFVTLMTNDLNDQFSNLDRPGIFRLNIGVSKQRFRDLLGLQTSADDESDANHTGYDFTGLDQLLPHPVYGRMHWVSVLNPSDATFETVVKPLLAEAYEIHVKRYAKRAANKEKSTT